MKKQNKFNLWFQKFATTISAAAGSMYAFLASILLIILWIICGPVFKFSDTWQLIINTGTTIVTFLMVFLIQHTQNRDTTIINLKLDELIKSHQPADNLTIDLDRLNDEELKLLEKKYKKMCQQIESKKKRQSKK
ncbi:low affinity iron permease family protein [Fluoribacter dumoffii]|uniref:low affinity iron permease family protein n=1 Tax=Fluoribacter dumoffii TaxID=463 RepID=UPI002243CFB3|nr:low affinity iron permease family protein [Fluoribacter dumoffii]MCW8419535.1 low affinity iron permease family protein [Fluoribacter dumoffii]MCW8455762.1 low affinity iron permease family protein [Fluoribacter dumoffii]MCW8460159.1 low affinity iron permease family protein [Fluoribacter dumoffii]MCW8483638.1 low affinity iron permease family protein [Fluoribacter dumoffii]